MVAAGLLLLLGTAVFGAPSLQDAATGFAVDFAIHVRPVTYLLAAPVFGVMDTLSLLTLSQHYALLGSLVVVWAAVRIGRAVTRSTPRRSLWRAALREGGLALGALLTLLTFYAAGMVVPRPMTSVRLLDPNMVAVDFHSHTNHSHDGWSLFDSRRNRSWHRGGGFQAAYVTDHYTWRGYDEARADNPRFAGEGVILLEGVELRIHGRPTNALGARARYLVGLDEDSVYLSPDSLVSAAARRELAATLLYTMPGPLDRVVGYSTERPDGVIGIEVNDGSPRGLEQVRRQREEIVALADSLDLALIGAANLHGWGRTVASWSVLDIPGWEAMSEEQLGNRIEDRLHTDRREAVTVVERRMPHHGDSKTLFALTLPRVVLEHFMMLSWGERAAWLLWGSAIWFLRRRFPRVKVVAEPS